MSSRKDYILQVLEKNECRHLPGSLPVLTEKQLKNSRYMSEIIEVYKGLGGLEEVFPVHLPPLDIELKNFAIILDEETAFNRYRASTLRSPIYENIVGFPLENYRRYCRMFEGECIKMASSGEKWTSKQAEKYFGQSEENGELAMNGSAKWKYIAFSDFLTDLHPLLLPYKIIRISIFDNLMINNKLTRFNSLLLSRNPQNEAYIWKYIARLMAI